MEQCKEEARENTRVLSKKLLENGEVSWTGVLDTAGHDELVYKLTLKYLRQQGLLLNEFMRILLGVSVDNRDANRAFAHKYFSTRITRTALIDWYL